MALSRDRVGDDLTDAAAAAVTPSDILVITSRPAAAGLRKVFCIRTAAHWPRYSPGLEARCVRTHSRLYLPMPFFWVGGFAAGILTTLAAGATLVTEPAPEPVAIAAAERGRVTLSAVGRIRPRPWRAMPTRSVPTSRRCSRAAWRRCCPQSCGPGRVRGRNCSA